MLPVVYGVEFTRLHILFYTIILLIVTLLPYLTHMSHGLYLISAVILGALFMSYALRLMLRPTQHLPMKTFGFSITYLSLLFAMLLVDHYFPLSW
jgi:protoheme IX farnesyltransferase